MQVHDARDVRVGEQGVHVGLAHAVSFGKAVVERVSARPDPARRRAACARDPAPRRRTLASARHIALRRRLPPDVDPEIRRLRLAELPPRTSFPVRPLAMFQRSDWAFMRSAAAAPRRTATQPSSDVGAVEHALGRCEGVDVDRARQRLGAQQLVGRALQRDEVILPMRPPALPVASQPHPLRPRLGELRPASMRLGSASGLSRRAWTNRAKSRPGTITSPAPAPARRASSSANRCRPRRAPRRTTRSRTSALAAEPRAQSTRASTRRPSRRSL